eukprot:2912697-Pyramimonas_sp.AAC.1
MDQPVLGQAREHAHHLLEAVDGVRERPHLQPTRGASQEPIARGKRAYTRRRNRSHEGREHIPDARTNRTREESIYPPLFGFSGGGARGSGVRDTYRLLYTIHVTLGKYRSSVEAREPQNRDDKVKNTRSIFKDSQEQAWHWGDGHKVESREVPPHKMKKEWCTVSNWYGEAKSEDWVEVFLCVRTPG